MVLKTRALQVLWCCNQSANVTAIIAVTFLKDQITYCNNNNNVVIITPLLQNFSTNLNNTTNASTVHVQLDTEAASTLGALGHVYI